MYVFPNVMDVLVCVDINTSIAFVITYMYINSCAYSSMCEQVHISMYLSMDLEPSNGTPNEPRDEPGGGM